MNSSSLEKNVSSSVLEASSNERELILYERLRYVFPQVDAFRSALNQQLESFAIAIRQATERSMMSADCTHPDTTRTINSKLAELRTVEELRNFIRHCPSLSYQEMTSLLEVFQFNQHERITGNLREQLERFLVEKPHGLLSQEAQTVLQCILDLHFSALNVARLSHTKEMNSSMQHNFDAQFSKEILLMLRLCHPLGVNMVSSSTQQLGLRADGTQTIELSSEHPVSRIVLRSSANTTLVRVLKAHEHWDSSTSEAVELKDGTGLVCGRPMGSMSIFGIAVPEAILIPCDVPIPEGYWSRLALRVARIKGGIYLFDCGSSRGFSVLSPRPDECFSYTPHNRHSTLSSLALAARI